MAALALGALGVVFGDIGTSPLYTINEINQHAKVQGHPEMVYGMLSLVFWALSLIMCVKYAVFVLRADKDGEGGTFALLALLKEHKGRAIALLTGTLLVFAAANLLGEGVLTPAISVLSAWEGTKPITGWFTEPKVVVATVLTLWGLFSVQKRGTDGIGRVFGPWMVLWFGAIAFCGARQLLHHPEVMQAVNPLYGVRFLLHEWHSAAGVLGMLAVFAVLGAVTLSFTGGEALYADLGHFNARAIRVAWFSIYPCLLLNYFGQGARLLEDQAIEGGNVFFAIVPFGKAGLVMMVILAVGATVIASQALISGAFSVCRSAINLGLMPRMKVVNTSEEHEGQIYMPLVNWTLCVLCLALVLWKRSSTNLAAAYGMAVTSVMLTTSISMMVVAVKVWKWSPLLAVSVFLPFLGIDLSFFTANVIKFVDGGYIPVALGVSLFGVMTTWRWGRATISQVYEFSPVKTVREFVELKMEREVKEAGPCTVVMSSRPVRREDDRLPLSFDVHWQSRGDVPKHVLFCTVFQESVPYVPAANRYEVKEFLVPGSSGLDCWRGSVISVCIHVGYMDSIDIRLALKDLDDLGVLKDRLRLWSVMVGAEAIIIPDGVPWSFRLRVGAFRLIHRLATPAHEYFGLERDALLTSVRVPIMMKPNGQHMLPVSGAANPYLAETTGA